MRAQQRGATLIGMVIILAIIGSGVYAGIRLLPVYMEYLSVSRALEQTAEEHAGTATVQALRVSLDRRWTVEDIQSISAREIEITKVGSGYSLRAWYRAETPFIGNVSLVADFDKTVMVAGR